GVGVMRGEETAGVELTATLADVDDAIADARRTGDRIRLVRVGDLHIPDLVAALRVDRDPASVDGADDELAVPVRGAAVGDLAADAGRRQFARHLRVELPQLLTRDGVEGKHLAPRAGQIELAIDHQRRALVAALVGDVRVP